MKIKNSNIFVMLLMAVTLLLSACSEIKNNKEENNLGIANPASEFCIEKGGKLEIKTNVDGSQSGLCKFNNGKECDEWAFFRGECEKDSYSNSELKLFCENEQGKWIESSKECEYIDLNNCLEKNGKFYECESACRNNPDAEMCTMQCVPVCKFEEKPKEKFCGGIAGISCEDGFNCKLDGDYPDAGGICIEDKPLICTKEYMPVCGADGKTYGNKCMAGNTEILYEGTCNEKTELIVWNLVKMNDKDIINSSAEISLDEKTMKMSGNSGCNRMFSEYNISNNKISFGMIGSTMMYCENSMNIETELLEILNEKELKIEYKDNFMNMYLENSLVLVWKKN